MRFLKILFLALLIPLAGCAAIQSAGFGEPDDIEDLPRNYNIFFGVDSSDIDGMAQDIIAQVAADAMRSDPEAIVISGFSGPAPDDTVGGIAEQRYTAVENALAGQGLDRALFMRAELAADPNLPELALRRVEIRFDFD
jgi:outer membrane protein OmpA-like peptidoglycan-associated protein